MNLDDVNDHFRSMAMRSIAEDVEAVIEQVMHLEAISRHEVECTGNTEAANAAAYRAYSIFMDVPMKLMPTLIMGLADRANRERGALLAALDTITDTSVKVQEAIATLERGRPHIAKAMLGNIHADLLQALEDAPYEKAGDGDA